MPTSGVRSPARYAHELLPAAHRIASPLKRWVLGTRQGPLGNERTLAYRDECAFRLNRRHPKAPGGSPAGP